MNSLSCAFRTSTNNRYKFSPDRLLDRTTVGICVTSNRQGETLDTEADHDQAVQQCKGCTLGPTVRMWRNRAVCADEMPLSLPSPHQM